MSTRNATIKNLVLSVTRDFKGIATRTFNDTAFAGEKLHNEIPQEAADRLKVMRDIGNLVVNGEDFPGEELTKVFEILKTGIENCKQDVICLIYYHAKDQKEIAEGLEGTFPYIFLRPSPIKKQDFLNVFYQRIKKPEPAAAPKPKRNAAFYEATAHVRDTIEQLGIVAKDRSNVAAVLAVGQRFNGFLGTFAFLGDVDGYKQLMDLSRMIDNIAYTYETDPSKTEVEQEHFNALMELAKAAFMILKDVRDGGNVTPENDAKHKEARQTYLGLSNLKEKEKNDQSSIDDLIDSLKSTGS